MISPKIKEKAMLKERLSGEEIAALLTQAPLCELGLLAHHARMTSADPERVTYVKDRNINYTNVCISGCRFCAYHKPPGHPEGFVISWETLASKIRDARKLGATQILLQGGLHPDLKLEFYVEMLERIRSAFGIHVHGLSPPEILHVARLEGLSLGETISALRDSGLHSIPGGGAEVLAESARERVSPGKCTAAEWLEVMGTAHALGMKTTATMMFGHGESVKELVEHLLAIRALQDETGGFTAFIPWTFQPANTALASLKPAGGHAYLRVLAVSRLALDNFRNLQVSWVTQGAGVAQTGLFFGANDFGSTMIEENVVAAAGVSFRMTVESLEDLIRSAGFEPAQRNQAYELMQGG